GISLEQRVADVGDAALFLQQIPDACGNCVEAVVLACAETEDDRLVLDLAGDLFAAGDQARVEPDLLTLCAAHHPSRVSRARPSGEPPCHARICSTTRGSTAKSRGTCSSYTGTPAASAAACGSRLPASA